MAGQLYDERFAPASRFIIADREVTRKAQNDHFAKR